MMRSAKKVLAGVIITQVMGISSMTYANTYTVQPGDTFTKYITILNKNSTYEVKLDIQKNLKGIPTELQDYIVIEDGKIADQTRPGVSGSQFENLDSIPARSNTGGYVTVKILDTEGAWEAINALQDNTLDLDATFTITATQAK